MMTLTGCVTFGQMEIGLKKLGGRNIDDAIAVLGYDMDSEWPPDSGVPYLQHFAPDQFAAGRRLAGSAGQLWAALVELAPGTAGKHLEFPMQHVAKATEAMLFQLASGGDWEEVTCYRNWLCELAKANFSDHMRIISVSS